MPSSFLTYLLICLDSILQELPEKHTLKTFLEPRMYHSDRVLAYYIQDPGFDPQHQGKKSNSLKKKFLDVSI
jgi:hypothetical protein